MSRTVLRELETAWLDNENPEGPIFLFLHGYPDTPESWEAQAAAFNARGRVIRPYARGVGGSQAPKDRRRYGAYSTLLDHLGILRHCDPQARRPVHVVGHDVGGVHAWMLATHPPPGLKSVAVLNSLHPRQYLRRLLWPRQVLKSWYMGAFQLPWLSEAALLFFNKGLMRHMEEEGWRPPSREMSLREFEGAVLNAMNQYRSMAREIPTFLREKAAPTAIPALVLSTEEDRYLEEPSGFEFSDIAERVTVRVIKGRHWVHREQPERVNRLLAEFWDALC